MTLIVIDRTKQELTIQAALAEMTRLVTCLTAIGSPFSVAYADSAVENQQPKPVKASKASKPVKTKKRKYTKKAKEVTPDDTGMAKVFVDAITEDGPGGIAAKALAAKLGLNGGRALRGYVLATKRVYGKKLPYKQKTVPKLGTLYTPVQTPSANSADSPSV